MKVTIFNVHFETSQYMLNNADDFENLDLIQKHKLCEERSTEFIKQFEEVEFDIINDDLYDQVAEFMQSYYAPPLNEREK